MSILTLENLLILLVYYIFGIGIALINKAIKIKRIDKLLANKRFKEIIVIHANLAKKTSCWLFVVLILMSTLMIIMIATVITLIFNQFISYEWYIISETLIFGSLYVILFVFLPVLMLTIILHPIEKIVANDELLLPLQYEPFGRLRNWSKYTDKFRAKKNWTDKFTLNVYEAMIKENILTDNRSTAVHIIGPSANSAECEEILATTIASRYAPGVIIDASDMINKPKSIKNITTRLAKKKNIKFNYRSKLNAMNLEKSKKQYLGKIDVVFDNKGALWHKLYRNDEVELLLKVYHNLLVVGGIVIIDSYPKRTFRTLFAQLQLQLFKSISWFAENSTAKMLNKLYKKSPEIQKLFDKKTIGKGLYAVTYLIKK